MNSTQVVREAALSLRQAIAMDTPKAVELWLDVVRDPAERGRQMSRLSSTDRRRLGELLDTRTGTELFESIDVYLAAKVLNAQPITRVAELLATLDAHRAGDILRRFDRDGREALLAAMPIERAKVLRGLLFWPTNAVASHMMTEPLTLTPTTTASQAVAQIRDRVSKGKQAQAGDQVYVIGPDQHLLGAVPLRDLVLAEADREVADLMEPGCSHHRSTGRG